MTLVGHVLIELLPSGLKIRSSKRWGTRYYLVETAKGVWNRYVNQLRARVHITQSSVSAGTDVDEYVPVIQDTAQPVVQPQPVAPDPVAVPTTSPRRLRRIPHPPCRYNP